MKEMIIITRTVIVEEVRMIRHVRKCEPRNYPPTSPRGLSAPSERPSNVIPLRRKAA